MYKLCFLFLVLLYAESVQAGLREDPVASLPTEPVENTTRIVIDGVDEADCSIGGGNNKVLCTFNGVTWNPGGGGGSTTPSLSAVIGVDRTYGGAVSSATAPRFGSTATGRYWLPYDDPTDGLQLVCEVSGVINDCDYIRKLLAGKIVQYKNSAGVSIFKLLEATGALEDVKIDGRTATITHRFDWGLDMCGVSPLDGTTVGHIWNRDPLSTAPTLTADVDTNVGRCVLTFPDTDTTYGVQITRQLPAGFVAGTLGANIIWDTTGTGNARFQIATKCYASNDAHDAAFNTATITTAAAGTSGRPNIVNVPAIDTTGCVGGNIIRLRVFRVRTEASDTLNAALNVEAVNFSGWDAQ